MGPEDFSNSRYTRKAKLLRFPVLFGSILGMFLVGFSIRKKYFADDIENVRRKNYEEGHEKHDIIEKAKDEELAEIARKKAKKS